MARTEQTFRNDKDSPVYISVELWPECFELEPGDKLTVIWNAPDAGETVQVDFINDRELVVYPNVDWDKAEFFLNGEPAQDRSWVFKHK